MSDQSEYKRILIIKLSSIGDVVMATPVAKALRKAFPDSYIAWVVEEKSKDVVVGNPYLDDVIVWKRPNGPSPRLRKAVAFLDSLARLSRDLRKRRFDLAIDLQGLLRSAAVARASGAPFRLGYDSAREGAALVYNLRVTTRREAMGPQNYLGLLKPLGVVSDDLDMHVPISAEDRACASGFLSDALAGSPGGCLGAVAMCPATTWAQKHWTEEGWAALADKLISEHRLLPVFLGSKADHALVGRIRDRMCRQPADVVGRTTLNQAAAVLEQARLTIAVDTGLMHISLALDRPTVGVFGPTKWKQFVNRGKFAVAAGDFPCMPCQRHPICREFDCMRDLTADDVMAKAALLLAGDET